MNQNVLEAIIKLEYLIRKFKKDYYKGNPSISDGDFDELEGVLKLLDPKNPALDDVGWFEAVQESYETREP